MFFFFVRNANNTLKQNKRYNQGLTRFNYSIRRYANYPTPRREVSTGTGYTIGAITVIGAITIGYAKYDPAFRTWLGDNVYGADKFFKVVFQETGKGLFAGVTDTIRELLVWDNTDQRRKRRDTTIEASKFEYEAPSPVFPALANVKEEVEKYDEIRVQNAAQIEVVQEKPTPKEPINSPKSLANLELKIRDTGLDAIDAYNRAGAAFRDYCRDVEEVIEISVERLDPSIWGSLKRKSDKKQEVLKEAERLTEDTLANLERFRCLIDEANFKNCEEPKATARRNIDRFIKDIRAARARYETELKEADITEKYWRKVETARCHFIEELEILFPNMDVNRKNLSLKPSDLDLFVVYAFAQVLHYQKEMNRLDILLQQRLKQVLDAARKGDPNFDVKEIAIREEVDREKRNLSAEFQKKCLALRKESEQELRHRLKCQEQAHVDHLADVLQAREAELERDFHRKLDERIAEEQAKYKTQMAGMVARMTGMRNAITERLKADKLAHQCQVLWSACQALHRAVKLSQPGVPWSEQMRPLQCEVDAIELAAAEGDELVPTILNAIPQEAKERGVFPEGALRERFLRVETEARRLALVPNEGARLPVYFLSFLQSFLLCPAANPIPQAELDDEKVDFSKLDTYDILQRARYWIDRGNYAQTLKYMNLLKGASKCIASEWILETRILLETQQAAEILMAHAVAGGLQHV